MRPTLPAHDGAMVSVADLNANELRVAVYFAAAALCILALQATRARHGPRRLLVAWAVLAGFMTLLGLARVIDFGPWLTSIGREQSQIEGWYDERRDVQRWAVLAVASGTLLIAAALTLLIPRSARGALPSAVAAAGILGFAFMRAISFHDVDRALYQDAFSGLLLNTIFELGLLLLFAVSVGWGLLARGRPTGDVSRS
jgi:hypothetical protein